MHRRMSDSNSSSNSSNGGNNNTDTDKIESPDAEVLDEEPRNLILALLSEIRIGMDLSRVTLPTFILEPRSMLEKLTDFMTHAELLALAMKIADPVERILGIVRWYLSGFYIKPQGVKKPYNPILGEFFRCKWEHDDGTTSYYVAEQVSHHPPISCIYISNRKAGFVINGSVHPRSKFLGTSAASILEGTAYLKLLQHDEEYSITFPSVYGRGILFGTLLMEMCGVVHIQCKNTHCKAELDFKAKPFWGGEYNIVQGKIKHHKDTVYTIYGKWDGRIDYTNTKTKITDVLWDSKGVKRTPKIIRPIDSQEEFESQRLWINVTNAIKRKDQREATVEKTKLEEAQRRGVKLRKERNENWVPRLFRKNSKDQWVYKYMNTSPYNPNEGDELEEDGIIYLTSRGKPGTIDMQESRLSASASSSASGESDGEDVVDK
jgi:hypothetical protein